ncbi:hypothetical protein HN51_008087, partial [Arachis hypogaea]
TQVLVALSRIHTLGSKGFGSPTSFDNAYYKILLEKPWANSGVMSSMIGLPFRSQMPILFSNASILGLNYYING